MIAMHTHTLLLGLRIKDKLLFLAQGAFFFLLLTWAFQPKHKIFKSLASMLTTGFVFPEGFQKSFYFYITDVALIVIGVLFFISRRNSPRTFFTKSAKYLTALLSIAFI